MRIVCLILIFTSFATGQSMKPCEAPKATQFDFWIGEWNLTWKDQEGKEGKGTNVVQKRFGSCVIEENFRDPAGGFEGMSVSVYSPMFDKWYQTWVDNQGSYLDFSGGFSDGRMVLTRQFTGPKGKTVHQRMIWYNLSENALDWNWEKSEDGGVTWTLAWQIHYERARR